MNLIEAIRSRRSVRNYSHRHLLPGVMSELRLAADSATSPFGGNVTIRLKSFDDKTSCRPGTYGMITGATEFFLVASAHDRASALSVGYMFEQVVIRARQMGLGTCWMAATFNGKEFDRNEIWPSGERLSIVSPIGFPANLSLKERLVRMAVGSKSRKPFESLFFNDDFSTPLCIESRYGESLEMMRLAPSSTNSQPWRAVVKSDSVRFYYRPKSWLSLVDCGIGLCHFYLTERYRNHNGDFFEETDVPDGSDGTVYLVSYRIN